MPIEPFKNIEYPSLRDLSHRFPPVEWLWPSWIPRGMLTLFGAAPGVGKSLVALDLARRVIHGFPFPDGTPGLRRGGDVLIVDAEGAPALLTQRAQAWRINSSRLFLMLSPDLDGFIDLAQPQQLEQLRRMIGNIQPALVVVDSLAAATSHGETSLQGARAILGSLAGLADMYDTALLVIHHLRKRARSGAPASAPQVAVDDLRGSSHISAAARSVLALSLIPDRPELNLGEAGGPVLRHALNVCEGEAGGPALRHALNVCEGEAEGPAGASPSLPISPYPSPLRRLEIVKTNLCRHPPPLALRLEGDGVAVPTLHYSDWVEPPPPPTQVDLCARWLLHYLAAAGAPVKPAAVVRSAREEGFTRSTVYRARNALAGRIVDLGNSPHDPQKRWTLAPEEAPLPKEPQQEGTPRDSETVKQ